MTLDTGTVFRNPGLGPIPSNQAIAEALAAGKTLMEFNGDSKAMTAIMRVWRRILLELELLHGNYFRDWFNGEICHRLDSVGIHLNY